MSDLVVTPIEITPRLLFRLDNEVLLQPLCLSNECVEAYLAPLARLVLAVARNSLDQ